MVGGSEKGCERQSGAIDNTIKISLINYIDKPPNPTSTNILAIADSNEIIHLARKVTPTMALVIRDNEIKERLPDGSTMESTHMVTLQLPGISRLTRQIHILPIQC